MEQSELLQKVGAILDKLDIPYIITGGIAVTVWGRPRYTADIDLVIEILPQNATKLYEALVKIDKNVYLDESAFNLAIFNKGEFNLIYPNGVKVDFWVSKNDVFERIRFKRKLTRKMGRQKLHFISPEDLILTKLLWYKKSDSTRQLEDVESILKIQKKLDWKYIKKWAEIQSTSGILESVLKNQKMPKFSGFPPEFTPH